MKLQCINCGAKKSAGKKRLTKLVAKFGSLEELQKQFLCRGCKKVGQKTEQEQVDETPVGVSEPQEEPEEEKESEVPEILQR